MSFYNVFTQAGHRWYERDAGELAAALAYYTPFALTPLLFVSVSVLSMVYGNVYVVGMLKLWGSLLGPDIINLLTVASENFRHSTPEPSFPILGALFFFSMIIVAFNTLMSGFHHLWEVPHSGIRGWLRKCWRSAVFVVVLQAYLIVVMGVDAFFLTEYHGAVSVVTVVVSLVATTLLFYLMYRFLTLEQPSRRGSFCGAVVASVLLLVAKNLIGLYVGSAAVPKLYDAAGLIIALLIWIYAVAAIIYYGACVVHEYDRARFIPPSNT